MKMPKTIQVDFELFVKLCTYFLRGETEHHEAIKQGLTAKVDKIIANQYFTKYKTSPPGSEREEWRRLYLDHIGMHKDWRSSSEKPEEAPPESQ